MEGQQQLEVDGPAVSVGISIYWNEGTGWRASFWSISDQESVGMPDEMRSCPTTAYDRLTLHELLDVIDAEASRRRGF